MPEQKVMRSAQRRGRLVAARRVPAGAVTEEGRAPRLVHGRPDGDTIRERVVHELRIIGESVGSVAGGPPARVLERLREIPVIESEYRCDAGGEQFVDEPAVEVEARLVGGAAAIWLDA